VPLDYEKLINWRFPVVTREYGADEVARFARGFGAGASAALARLDAPFLLADSPQALPFIAVPLTDGEFWQQNPDTGIVWQQIIHAEEALTMHRPLPGQGTVVISQRIVDILDRGADKGAVMLQQQFLHDEAGECIATIDVTTMLRANGGFGGKPYAQLRQAIPGDRPADAVLELRSACGADAMFRLSAEIAVGTGAPAGKSMVRGVGCFGTAGRAVLAMACGNQPARLRRMAVRYAGPMFTDELLRVELWHTGAGRAVWRMVAPERHTVVLDNCLLEYQLEEA
jgi:hypothetical protein